MRATVTFEDGKIVCVQKAKKEGQKSTKVMIMMLLMIMMIIVMMMMIMVMMRRPRMGDRRAP